MTNPAQTRSNTSRALLRCTALACLFIVLIFVLPTSHATMHAYNLSSLQYRLITLSLAFPILVVWFAAFLGSAKLRDYAYQIRKTPQGLHFNNLANACTWLALSLPVPAIAGQLLNALANKWANFHPTAIIITNYINIILPLIAFSIVGIASRGLIRDAKLTLSLATTRFIMILFLVIGVLFCYLTFRQFDLTSLQASTNPYFLPLWLMVITVTIPSLYAWFVGLLAAYEIGLYSKQSHGLLYRKALRLMIGGLIAVIVSLIALQYLNSVQPRIGHLVLDYRLLLNLLFRIIGGIGFILLALGATRLKRIEEV